MIVDHSIQIYVPERRRRDMFVETYNYFNMLKHAAPLGLGLYFIPVFYKHIAALRLKEITR
jgi:hypothetical protein